MQWDYEGEFLKYWPAGNRSLIANQFCSAVREGCRTVDDVLCWVRADARRRIGEIYGGYRDEVQELLLTSTGTEEARRFAEHIIFRESLSYEEKQKLKSEGRGDFKRLHMASHQPSERQLVYLKSLGCKTVPNTMLEASELIEHYKNGPIQRQRQSSIG